MTDSIIMAMAAEVVEEAKKFSIEIRKAAWKNATDLHWEDNPPIGKEYMYHDYLEECKRIANTKITGR